MRGSKHGVVAWVLAGFLFHPAANAAGEEGADATTCTEEITWLKSEVRHARGILTRLKKRVHRLPEPSLELLRTLEAAKSALILAEGRAKRAPKPPKVGEDPACRQPVLDLRAVVGAPELESTGGLTLWAAIEALDAAVTQAELDAPVVVKGPGPARERRTLRVVVDRFGNLAAGSEVPQGSLLHEGDDVSVEVDLTHLYGIDDAWFKAPDVYTTGAVLNARDENGAIVVPGGARAFYVWSPSGLQVALGAEDAAIQAATEDETSFAFAFGANEAVEIDALKLKVTDAGDTNDATYTFEALPGGTLRKVGADGTCAADAASNVGLTAAKDATAFCVHTDEASTKVEVSIHPDGRVVVRAFAALDGSLARGIGTDGATSDLVDGEVWGIGDALLTKAQHDGLSICSPDEAVTRSIQRLLPVQVDTKGVPDPLYANGKVYRCPVDPAAPSASKFVLMGGLVDGEGVLYEQLGSGALTILQGVAPVEIEVRGTTNGVLRDASRAAVAAGAKSFPTMLGLYEGPYQIEVDQRFGAVGAGTATSVVRRAGDAFKVGAAPPNILPVEVGYGVVWFDAGRTVAPIVTIAPQLAPRAVQKWYADGPTWARQAFAPVGGLRFAGAEDPIGLLMGMRINFVPGFAFVGGLQFGTKDLTTPWTFERGASAGLAIDPILLAKAIKIKQTSTK